MARALIGDQEILCDDVAEVRNPYDGQVVDTVPILTSEWIRKAIDAASKAQEELQSLSPAERSRMLLNSSEAIRSNAEELAKLTAREIGRPIRSARADVIRAAAILDLAASEVRHLLEGKFVPLGIYDYPAGNSRRLALTLREPLGVVATITPFNFPAASFAHKIGPALAVGNAVVHKPAISAPLTQLRMAQLIRASGFPAGALNVVTGSSSLIGNEFLSSDKISLISFTGSEKVGLEIASRAVSSGKRVIMELGGSDAEIVFEDADMEKAARAAVLGRFDYAGQFCNATKRLIVERKAREAFLQALLSQFQRLKVGDPLEEDTDVGPLISDVAAASVREIYREAVQEGALEIAALSTPRGGSFFPPTILEEVKPTMRLFSEEVFGPLLPVVYFDVEDEAIGLANATRFGLDASIFTSDLVRAFRVAKRLKVGTVTINDTTRLRWDNLPFGGTKRSGIGRESVTDTMMEMTEPKLLVFAGDFRKKRISLEQPRDWSRASSETGAKSDALALRLKLSPCDGLKEEDHCAEVHLSPRK